MKRQSIICLLVALLLCVAEVSAQSGIYIPSAKPVRNMQKALVEPEVFCLLISYGQNDSTFSLADLDLLDSAYRIAFDPTNHKMYTMMVEGYGDSVQSLTQSRVDEVFNYFVQRCHAPFPIRFAPNPISCSCHGDTIEQVRFEVPVSLKVYDCAQLPESRRLLNKTIKLDNSVLVTFHNNPAECIGLANGCYLPGEDTVIRGYYSSISMPKGAVYSVRGTKDSCPAPLKLDIEEHFEYEKLVERYFLVPHPKQVIAHAGYVVLKSNFNRKYGECERELEDSVLLRIPITQEQWDNKLRVYAKKYSEKGAEYRMITARKITNKKTGSLYLQVALNPTMFDTIFFGKRVKPDEMSTYFYEVENDREEGTIKFKDKFYKAYRMNRRGDYESRKALRVLFRQEVVQEEDKKQKETPAADDPDSEEINED